MTHSRTDPEGIMGRKSSRASSLLAAAAAVALVAPSACAADLGPDLKILWDQRDGNSGIGVVVQNFEANYDAYDCQGADDFVVPEGEAWVLRSIDAVGTHFAGIGPLRSMHVTIHRDSEERPGRPGDILADVAEASVEQIGCEGCGEYLVRLPEPVEVGSGRHWVALQGNIDFDSSGEWGWLAAQAQRGKPGLWRNPGGGFGVGCTDYRKQVKCIGDNGQSSDYVFALQGQRRRP
jgi:hypothetical protein